MDIQRKVLGLQSKIFRRACQNCIVSVQKTFWRKKEDLRILWVLIGFGYWAKKFRLSLKKHKVIWTGKANLQFTCPEKHYKEKRFFWELWAFGLFFGVWEKSFRHSGKIFWRCCKTCFLLVPGINLRKTFFFIKSIFIWPFSDRDRKISGFWNICPPSLSKLFLLMRRAFRGDLFLRELFFWLFLRITKILSAFCLKLCDTVVKTSFYVFIGTLRG